MTGTAGQLRVPVDFVASTSIPIPPLQEQILIVNRIELLLERTRKANESLEKIPQIMKRFRQAALKKAFSGELTAEWRAQQQELESAAELLKRIREERKHHYEEEVRRAKAEGRKPPKKPKYLETALLDASYLPELSDLWTWCKLGNVLEIIQYGTSVKADAPSNDGIPVLRMGNIQEGTIDYRDLKYIYEEKEDLNKYKLTYGDILINRTNSPELVGKSAIFNNDKFFVFASYLIRLRVVKNGIEPKYLNLFLNCSIARDYVASVRHQVAGQANINSKNIISMPIPLPPLPEQQEIVRRIESLFKFADETEKNAAEARKRVELMTQSILARAFRGDLSADFREAIRNWKDLDAEARGRYVFVLLEEEREKVLNANEFPMETAGQLLERIREERVKGGWKSRRKKPL